MTSDPWWPFGAPSRKERARLICFPFAGGGASVYRSWREAGPAGLEICPVQLPGRERRIRETPFRRVRPLVDRFMERASGEIPRPYAFFGHSMGALVAFELARELQDRRLPGPDLLIASAARPPHRMRRADPLHALPDQDFRAALRDLQGTPEAVLEHDELMALVLPTLRADFELCETYEYRDGRPLGCPILVIGGTNDPNVSPEVLREWDRMTQAGCGELILQAGHFFLDEHGGAILKRIEEEMTRAAGDARRPLS